MMINRILKAMNDGDLNYNDLSIIAPTMSLTKDLKLDSLDKVELIMAVEEEFKVEIEEKFDFNNINDIIICLKGLGCEEDK